VQLLDGEVDRRAQRAEYDTAKDGRGDQL